MGTKFYMPLHDISYIKCFVDLFCKNANYLNIITKGRKFDLGFGSYSLLNVKDVLNSQIVTIIDLERTRLAFWSIILKRIY